jgi:hypothetical protein
MDAFHQSINDNCDKCHGTNAWSPSTFDHSSYFVLDKHHDVKCVTCHAGNDFTAYSCFGCHEHSESKMVREHSEEGIFNITDCASCHRSGDEHDIRMRDPQNRIINSNEKQRVKDYIESGKKKEHEKEKDKDDD